MDSKYNPCANCIWEDTCGADKPYIMVCDDYYNVDDEITYDLLAYWRDLCERAALYQEIVEEQQS